jgi:hypothetical protein
MGRQAFAHHHGIEPWTPTLQVWCSTSELKGHFLNKAKPQENQFINLLFMTSLSPLHSHSNSAAAAAAAAALAPKTRRAYAIQ